MKIISVECVSDKMKLTAVAALLAAPILMSAPTLQAKTPEAKTPEAKTPATGQSTPAVRQAAVKKIYLMPARRGVVHGDVFVLLSDGTRKRLTTSKLCSDARLAADGKTMAWIEGSYEESPYSDDNKKYYYPEKIICYRDGKKVSVIAPEKRYEIHWQFQKNGAQIATSSAGSHGPHYFQLFDVKSGKQIALKMSYDAPRPAWAKELPGQ